MELFEYLQHSPELFWQALGDMGEARSISAYFWEGVHFSRKKKAFASERRIPFLVWTGWEKDLQSGVVSIRDGFNSNQHFCDVAILIHPTWKTWLCEDEALRWIKIFLENRWSKWGTRIQRFFQKFE